MVSIIRSRLPTAALVALLLATVWISAFRPPAANYPRVLIDAPGQLRIDFLFASQGRAASCLAMATNVAGAIQSACPGCRIVEHQCLRTLDSDQQHALSAKRIDIPSGLLPNGVVTYASPDPDIALSACKESERQSHGNTAGRVVCYPAGADRPALGIAVPSGAPTLGTALLALAGASVILWAVPFIWLRHKHGATFPAHTQRRLSAFGLLLADLFGWLAALALTWLLEGQTDGSRTVLHSILVLGTLLALLHKRNLYTHRHPFLNEARAALPMYLYVGILDAALLFLTQAEVTSHEFLTFWGLASALWLLIRVLARQLLIHSGAWQFETIVIGAGETASEAIAELVNHPWLGMRVTGVLAADQEIPDTSEAILKKQSIPKLAGGGSVDAIERVLADLGFPQIMIAIEKGKEDLRARLLERLSVYYPTFYDIPTLPGLPLYSLEGAHSYQMESQKLNSIKIRAFKLAKRAIDICVSATLLLMLTPILMIVALAILILEGRPVFYVSKRHISIDKTITVLKFRTMVKDATSEKYNLVGRFMKDGYLDIPVDCEVYTRIGRFLEKSQLVESLQLINVLFHGMSFIGNRPLPANNLKLLAKFPNWEQRFDSPAGMTGMAQVVGKFSLQPLDRIGLEIDYSRVYNNGNILMCDVFIAYYTVRLILFGKPLPVEGAYSLINRCLYRSHEASHSDTKWQVHHT